MRKDVNFAFRLKRTLKQDGVQLEFTVPDDEKHGVGFPTFAGSLESCPTLLLYS